MKSYHVHAAALVLCLAPQFASAGVIESGRLTDGLYGCSMYTGSMNMIMGDIRIRGLSYQGPGDDGHYQGGPYPYRLAGKVILWGGPMGGWSSGGNKVGSTTVFNNDAADPSFKVIVISAGGNADEIDCVYSRK